uniref:Beta-mannanase n=1 Tax=Symbiotic protist of Reticulitermes speratus TaxID=356864 RepID=UPI0003F4A89D
ELEQKLISEEDLNSAVDHHHHHHEFQDWNISSSPVTPSPSAGAQKLYSFLVQNFQKKIISGAMTLQGGDESAQTKEPDWLQQNAGHRPALVGLDFMFQTGKGEEWYYNDSRFSKQVVNGAKSYWQKGGIPALCWHWRDPSKDTDAFYSPSSGNSATQFDADQAVKSGTAENKAILQDLAVIADQLQDLRDAGVAVLWRPLHEASGKWFWWGYKGADALKKLWKIEFDYFVKERNLNNLIWVFTAGTPIEGIADWYPGDDMVDVIGMDIYATQGDHATQQDYFNQCKSIFKGRKIVAMSECGSVPEPDLAAPWSFFMPWYNNYCIPEGSNPYNSLEFWKKTMSSSLVITLDNMPGW